MSDLILERLVRQNNQQIIARSNRSHLIQEIGSSGKQTIKFHDRLFYRLGEWMIRLGRVLKERHPAPEHRPALG